MAVSEGWPTLRLARKRGRRGVEQPATPAGRRADFIEWATDGKTLLFASSARDERYLDLYEYDVASGRSQRLWEASGKLSLGTVSRDHRRFIISETLSDTDSNLYLVERGAKAKPILLTPHHGDSADAL